MRDLGNLWVRGDCERVEVNSDKLGMCTHTMKRYRNKLKLSSLSNISALLHVATAILPVIWLYQTQPQCGMLHKF